MTDAELDGTRAGAPSVAGSGNRAGVMDPAVRTLARLYGVQPAYRGAGDRLHSAPESALLHVLRALGAPVEAPPDAADALRARRLELGERLLEPASVHWRDPDPPHGPGDTPARAGPTRRRAGPSVRLCLPAGAGARVRCRLEIEGGGEREWEVGVGELTAQGGEKVEGKERRLVALPLPADLPDGVHRLRVHCGEAEGAQWVIRAPRTAFPGRGATPDADADAGAAREWGVFLPLYALRTERSWGTADLTDLRALAEWAAGLGARVVGTLPLLASHLGDGPFDPSPYAPASRLFWNELYVDVEGAPELDSVPGARRLLESPEFRNAVAGLRGADRVDYEASARWKHRALQPLADAVVGDDPRRHTGLRAWLEGRPEAVAYARFRAVTALERRGWREWPEPLRSAGAEPGRLDRAAAEPSAFRLHLYAQWLADRQMARLGEPGGAGLHLDLPLGTHPDGFDTWRHRSLFADGVTGGAPPDAFFEGGQDWGFPPLDPEALRADAYAYWRAALRTQLRHTDLLRVDHVMGFHRLFWVPRGLGAREGVYVRYPAEELWALLCLESTRHGTEIVGEDLGTVPREVRRAMDRHGVRRMYVVPFELRGSSEDGEPRRKAEGSGRGPGPGSAPRAGSDAGPGPDPGGGPDPGRGPDPGGGPGDVLTPVPANAVASLGTHDLPPFAAFWRDSAPSAGIRDDAGPALRRLLAHLAASPARWLLVSLEDLWLETEPQNLPGPDPEGGSWRRKARHTLEELAALPGVVELLREVDRLRGAPPERPPGPAGRPSGSHETTAPGKG